MIFKRNKQNVPTVHLQSSKVKTTLAQENTPEQKLTNSVSKVDEAIQELRASIEAQGLTVDFNTDLNCCHKVRITAPSGEVLNCGLRFNAESGNYFARDIVKMNDGIIGLLGD